MATTVETDKIEYGGDLMGFVDGKPVAFSTDAKMSVKTNTRDVSSKDSGYWTERQMARHDWNASMTAYYTDVLIAQTTMSFNQLMALKLARKSIALVFSASEGDEFEQHEHSTKKRFLGDAIITDLSPSAPDGETASYTVAFEGKSKLMMSASLVFATANGTKLELTHDIDMADPAAFAADFSVKKNGAAAAIASVGLKAGAPNVIEITLTQALVAGQVILVSMTAGNVDSEDGIPMYAYTDHAVTNNT